MKHVIWLFLPMFLANGTLWADDVKTICFFPEKVNFGVINKTCKKGDLIRTKPSMAELVCDWDKQIFQYREENKDWITCIYHGEARRVVQGEE